MLLRSLLLAFIISSFYIITFDPILDIILPVKVLTKRPLIVNSELVGKLINASISSSALTFSIVTFFIVIFESEIFMKYLRELSINEKFSTNN